MTTPHAEALAAELGIALERLVREAGFEWVVDMNRPERRLVMSTDLETLVLTILLDGYRFGARDRLGREAHNLEQLRELLNEHTPDRHA